MSTQDELKNLIYDHFNDDLLLICDRVWEAWQIGTMTQDDFRRIDEDDDVLSELIAKTQSLITRAKVKAVKAFAEELRQGVNYIQFDPVGEATEIGVVYVKDIDDTLQRWEEK